MSFLAESEFKVNGTTCVGTEWKETYTFHCSEYCIEEKYLCDGQRQCADPKTLMHVCEHPKFSSSHSFISTHLDSPSLSTDFVYPSLQLQCAPPMVLVHTSVSFEQLISNFLGSSHSSISRQVFQFSMSRV